MESFGPELLKLVQIIWINIILSGDNAVVIAMACMTLPPRQRLWGMIREGKDPAPDKLGGNQRPTMAELCRRFIDEYAREHKKASSTAIALSSGIPASGPRWYSSLP